MNNLLKVSVIMPAYNSEKYLAEALESALNQSMDSSEYEIIVVNDGSTDHTLEILKDYAAHNDNIKIIDKENGGPSSARNAALDIARGQSYFFFDSDDIMDSDALQMLYDRMVEMEADLVISRYDWFDEKVTKAVHHLDSLVQRDEIDRFDLDILNTFIMTNKLYSAKIVRDHHIRFAPISYSEDGVFLFEFLSHCKKITGLDEIVFHYRQYDAVKGGSITSAISEPKVRDYITAHRRILELAKESLKKRDEQENQILIKDEDQSEYVSSKEYISELLKKEIRILLMNFYPQVWRLDKTTTDLIVDEIRFCLPQLDLVSYTMISQNYPMYSLTNLERDKREIAKKTLFTIILYGTPDVKDSFLKCLYSLVNQDLIYIKIVLPSIMEEIVREAGLAQDNMVFCQEEDEDAFIIQAVNSAETDFICIADYRFSYIGSTFSYVSRFLSMRYVDFLTEVIYHNTYGEIQPSMYSRIVADSFLNGHEYNDALALDYTLANKFFRTSFLKEMIHYLDQGIDVFIFQIYHLGYFRFKYDRKVIFEDNEEAFRQYIWSEDAKKYLDTYLDDHVTSLLDKKLQISEGKAFLKILQLDSEDPVEEEIQRCIEKYKEVRPKNRVAFLSIRSDNGLQGNALALYESLKGCKKEFCTAMLPHDSAVIDKMVRLIMTSRVIVTDDYLKYVRYIPLRPQQRLIQLWHACGAFKKFGIRGTNLSARVDSATHAQYNLVCVSGQDVRGIYADAFGIEVNKVHALGVPRTDRFYDEAWKKKIVSKIYKAHPEFREKHMLLYAPTFRDIGQNRSIFHPNIDFDALSGDLSDDQILVICPHPVMQNDIIDKEYSNIFVLRDFSTNEYMIASDLLITDYSSVIFEYALLEKPILFFCYDSITYNRGFYLTYPDDLPGPVFFSQKELTDYLKGMTDYKVSEQARDFVARYMDGCDGNSGDRIASLIQNYMKIPYILMTDRYRNLKKKYLTKNVSGPKKMLGKMMEAWEDKYGL